MTKQFSFFMKTEVPTFSETSALIFKYLGYYIHTRTHFGQIEIKSDLPASPMKEIIISEIRKKKLLTY